MRRPKGRWESEERVLIPVGVDVPMSSLGDLSPTNPVAEEHSHAEKVAFCQEQILREMPQPNTATGMAAVMSIVNGADISTKIANGMTPDEVAAEVVARCKDVVDREKSNEDAHIKETEERNRPRKRVKLKKEAMRYEGISEEEFNKLHREDVEAKLATLFDNKVPDGVRYENGMWRVDLGDGAAVFIRAQHIMHYDVQAVKGIQNTFSIVRKSAPYIGAAGIIEFGNTETLASVADIDLVKGKTIGDIAEALYDGDLFEQLQEMVGMKQDASRAVEEAKVMKINELKAEAKPNLMELLKQSSVVEEFNNLRKVCGPVEEVDEEIAAIPDAHVVAAAPTRGFSQNL